MDTKGKYQIFIIILLLCFLGYITYLFLLGEKIFTSEAEDSAQGLYVVFNKDSYHELENSVSGNPVIDDKSLSLNIDLQGAESFYEGELEINNFSNVDVYLKSIDLSSDSDINYTILYNDIYYNELADSDKLLINNGYASLKIRIEPKEIFDEIKETKINLSIKYATY